MDRHRLLQNIAFITVVINSKHTRI